MIIIPDIFCKKIDIRGQNDFRFSGAKKIQSPEVGGRIQVSGDSDLSPGLLSFSGNQISF
jgi:hypothetical protein